LQILDDFADIVFLKGSSIIVLCLFIREDLMLPGDYTLFILMLVLYTAAGLLALFFYQRPQRANAVSNLVAATASLCGIFFALQVLLNETGRVLTLTLQGTIPYLSFTLTIDKLAAFFILALAVLTFAVSLYSVGYLQHYYGKKNIALFGILYNLFIIAMVLVFTAGNMAFFLLAWEMMSLVSYFLVIFENEQKENLRSGLIYLVMTHLGTALIMIAMAFTATYSGSLEITALGNSLPAPVKDLCFVLFFLGFGTKAGIVPLHIWLPLAHPAAPSNVSALMSGIMIKTAIYGILRFVFILLGPGAAWWGTVIMIAGLISAVLGITFALAENNIKRLLAYSSIENMGIILIGLGLALSAAGSNQDSLAALAVLAALFHTLNHSLFKGVLFLGAGSLHYATHSKDLENMGGLLKKMPYAGLFFLLASLAIAALPPFNGFVSEWLTYQALFANLFKDPAGLKLLSILAVAGLALTGGMTAACFVKVNGIAFLGLPRTTQAEKAREVPVIMYIPMALLTLLCLLCGLFPRFFGVLPGSLVQQLTGLDPLGGLHGKLVLLTMPLIFNANTVLPVFLLILFLALLAGVWLLVLGLGGKSQVRCYTTWDCGFPSLNARMQYSATGFSKPFRIVLRALYRPYRELQVEQGASPYYPRSMRYVVSTQPVFENYIYRPIANLFTRSARLIKLKVQTGSVHIYLIYIFVALVVLLSYNGVN